jgi:tetratricopeptide (TPR) repeat protein
MWAEAQRVVSTACIEAGRAADGDARAAWVLANFPALSPAQTAALQAARVRGLIDLGVPGQALALANQAVETARASGAIEAMLRALDARLYALMHVSDASGAAAAGAMLIEAAEQAGDVVLATRGRINTGSVLNHLGMFEEAQAMLERSLTDARARRMRILEAFALHNVGMSYARLGNLDEAISCQRHAARIADETSAARLRIHTRCYEAIFLVWRGAPGDLGAAHTLARFVCDETRTIPGLYTTAVFVLGKVQMARRYLESALELCRESVQRLESLPVEEWEEATRLTLAETLLAIGHDQEADLVLDAAFAAVVKHAGAIARADHRHAYLTRVEEVRRIVDLGRDRLGRVLPDLPERR